MIRSVIESVGAYLPEKTLTNADLEKMVDTTDEWIQQRTGIKERRIASDKENTAFMALAAAKEALENSGLSAADIDGIIVATSTPDQTFPSVAVKVQEGLGIAPCLAFDLQAVCSGFVYALATADNFIKVGQCRNMLVIGAERMSSILNWEDRTTCVLFGDGAGAVVLRADEKGTGALSDRGIFSTHLYADGRLRNLLYTTGGTSTTKESGTIVMEGREVFRNAVQFMADIVGEVLDKNNIEPAAIDWLVPHQANIRIIEATAKKLDLGMDRVMVTVDRHGNTSAASIPLAFYEGVKSGKIKKNDMILFEALGAGLTWGAALIRF